MNMFMVTNKDGVYTVQLLSEDATIPSQVDLPEPLWTVRYTVLQGDGSHHGDAWQGRANSFESALGKATLAMFEAYPLIWYSEHTILRASAEF